MTALNPELRRHLWLELTPRRFVTVPVILALLLSPWLLVEHNLRETARVATWLYYALVLVWGSWLSANAVISEIRARTWDLQRLSALSPWAMMWGKLIGAPVLVWYAGGLCLIAIIVDSALRHSPLTALVDLIYYVTVGLFAHSVSLLASLLAVRRRARYTWFAGFNFTIAGIVAGSVAASLWTAARNDDLGKTINWYGASLDAPEFMLVSLFVFFVWALIGNWRLMRSELQVRNGPWAWIGFLVFLMVYYAGFADVISQPEWRHAIRLASAGSASAVLAYVMMLLEPKDAVHIRWLLDQLAHGRIAKFVGGMQSWMFAYVATVAVALWLILTLDVPSPRAVIDQFGNLSLPDWWESSSNVEALPWRALVVAVLLFMTRDLALFLTFNFARRPKRADFLSVLWLVLLYAILPWLAAGLFGHSVLPLFVAAPAKPAWLGPVFPAAEAAVLLAIASGRLFALDRKTSG